MNTTLNPTRLMLIAGVACALAAATACQQQKSDSAAAPPSPVREPVPWDPTERPVSQLLTQSSGANMQPGGELISRVRMAAPAGGVDGVSPNAETIQPGELIPVKLALRNADAVEVLHILIGAYLQRGFVLDPKVAGVITLDVDQEMTRQDILDLIGGLSMIYGWVVEDRAGVMYVRPADQLAKLTSTPILEARSVLDTDDVGIRVRTLRYITAADAEKVIKELMSTGSKLVTIGRTLVLVDTVRQLNRVAGLIAALDVPEFSGVEIWTYRLAHRTPESAVQSLTTITSQSKLTSGADALVSFAPLPGTNRLMAISRDPTAHSYVRSFIEQIDQPPDKAPRSRYLYRIQHYDPVQLKRVLEEDFAGRIESPTSPGSGSIRLTIDAAQDLMIITATPYDYEEIMRVIEAIDRPPQQARVQAIILEVTLNDTLQYGVEYFLQALDQEGLGILELAGATTMPVNPTGSAFFVAGDGLAIIQALQRASTVDILSQPEMFITDKAEGEIQVGGEVPIVTSDIDSQTQDQGTTAIRRQIEYRKTGLILSMQPKINESGLIELRIEQEIADVGRETELGPEFTTRNLTTTAVVPHGYTLVLGGIIQRAKRSAVEKIPLVGDIPILGYAFQGHNHMDVRTELVIAITPTIVNQPQHATALTSDFLRRAAAVRLRLEELAIEESEPFEGLIRMESFQIESVNGVDQTVPQQEPQPPAEPAPEMPEIMRQMIEQSRKDENGGG